MYRFALIKILLLPLFLFSALPLHSQTATENIAYTYDELGRLTIVEDGVNTNRNYFYDATGNRTSVALGTNFPPQKPTGLMKSQIANCAWRADWAAVAGATSYSFRTSQGTTVSVTNTTYTFSCPSNNPTANQPSSVQACNAHGCSAQAYF